MSDRAAQSPAHVVAISLASLVGLWVVAARLGKDPSVLPGPSVVWQILTQEAASGELQRHLWATLRRVILAFSLAMGLGLLIGIALGMTPRLNRWFAPWLVVLLNIPALVVIVLCYLWIGLNEVAAITAVALNKTAMVAVTLREGVHALDRQLSDMSRAYRMPALTRLLHVILPQLWPFIAASTRNGLAIIWKIVLSRTNGMSKRSLKTQTRQKKIGITANLCSTKWTLTANDSRDIVRSIYKSLQPD